MKLLLGTRGSRLAMTQSESMAAKLRAHGHEVELVKISTRGDENRDAPFAQIGAPGVFVRELERALLDGRVDLVVHSYKDLPSVSPEGLVVAAIPERLDPADWLVIRRDVELGSAAELLPLPKGSRVGTASARRRALIEDLRPDLRVEHLRGNVPTRLGKLSAGDYEAIVLAGAGLERLMDGRTGDSGEVGEGSVLAGLVHRRLDPSIFVPAPAQGALALQVRRGESGRDQVIQAAVAELDDARVRRAVGAERRVLARVEGGCQVAVGAWCREHEDHLHLDAVFEISGQLRRGQGRSGQVPHHTDEALTLADSVAAELLACKGAT